MMSLLVYEDICGGGCADQNVASSLKIEALAMLCAVLEDFSKLDVSLNETPLEVVTLWDQSFGAHPFQHLANVRVIEVTSANHAEDQFIATLRKSHSALVIAPESESRLQTLCSNIKRDGCISFNSSQHAIELCADKLALANHLQQHQIPTVSTQRAGEELPDAEFFVVKPQFGAGSMGIDIIPSSEFQSVSVADNDIVQPLVRGEHYSIGCFYHSTVDKLICLPIAKQNLSVRSNFQYQGGNIPVNRVDLQHLAEMARQVVDSIEGLHGYFGIDFVVPENGQPILIEVNPRLTTSYVGYRAMTQTNLAKFFFTEKLSTKITWEKHVTYSPAGEIKTRPLTEMEIECCRN